MNINNELKIIYQQNWSKLLNELNEIEDKNEFTSPLLLKFPENYFFSMHKRIMVFGQETRGWQNKINNELKPIDEIMDGYERYFFMQNMKYRDNTGKLNARSSFRSGILNLKKGLKKRNIDADLIWNNINKIGRHNENVGVNSIVRNIELNSFNIISKEVALLSPDFFIFFTGPYRDKEILNKFPNFKIEKYKTLSKNEFVLIKNDKDEIVGFRTFHPNYLKGFYSMLDSHCFDVIEQVLK